MKKLFLLFLVLLTCVVSYGQEVSSVTRFLGIPIDGTKAEMISKLKDKGFTSVPGTDGTLEGEFNGKDVFINVQTNNRKVCRIIVMDKYGCDESQIKINFNNLCRQFEDNPKYIGFDQTIPESEDISYEMTIHNKRYEAAFCQKFDTDIDKESLMNRIVWFMISKNYGEFRISIYYENGYNMANGEDL